MAKEFNARLRLKYDSYANWTTNNPVLLEGEAAVCVIPADTGAVQGEPAVLIKIGDGVKKFSELPFLSGKAADVYGWAKAATKPEYSASEIAGLADYISGKVQDTNTKYQIVQDKTNTYKFHLQAKELNGDWADVGTFTVPEKDVSGLMTKVVDGTANHFVMLDNEGNAADSGYTFENFASKDHRHEIASVTGLQAALDAKAASTDLATLGEKVGTVPNGKTVVQMIEEAQTAATYDDTTIKADIAANKSAIETLNGDATKEGSVKKQVADAVAGIVADAPDAYDTLKEISDWISTHTDSAATMNSQITANKNAIDTLNGTGAGSVSKAVADAQATLQASIDGKVSKETGKGLSTNDYTTAEKNKLKNIAEGAQVNVIEEIQVNGTKVTPSGKAVNISVPTGALSAKDKVAKTDLADALKTEIEGKVNTSDCGDIISHDAADFAAAVAQLVYPVGAIYMSTVETNPSTLFGFGTWERIQDTFLLAAGSTYSAGSTGGEATHTLTEDEIPAHRHKITYPNASGPYGDAAIGYPESSNTKKTWMAEMCKTESVGGGTAHNNMPPYLAVYVWKRTA